MTISVADARAQIAAQIVDGADNSITPSKLRQVLLDAVDALNAALTSAYAFQGAWNPGTGSFPGSGAALKGYVWRASGSGTVDGQRFDAGDEIVAIADNASTSTYAGNWMVVQGTIDAADIVTGVLAAARGGAGATNGILKANGSGAVSAAASGTDYYNPGGTDVAVADGGTGASTAVGARTNLGLGSAKDARRDRIVDGGMLISQENGTTAGSTDAYYAVDGFFYKKSHDGSISVAQVASVTPGGSPNRLRATVTGTDTSIASGQYAYIEHRIEGQMVADFRYGGASAKAAILRFGVKAPAGTYCVSVTNSATNRSFVAEVVVSGGEANTDVVKTVAISGDTTGTWLTDTGIGLSVRWCLAGGSTYQGATGWSAGNYLGTSSQSNFLGTNSQVFELFDVGLYLDIDGSATAPPWELPDYADALRRCQRYYCKLLSSARGYLASGGASIDVPVYWPVPMRAAPATSLSGGSSGNVASSSVSDPGATGARFEITSTGAGDTYRINATVTANIRL